MQYSKREPYPHWGRGTGGESILKERFQVTGMSCAACSSKVERTVNHLNGVQKAEVNLLANAMTVEYDETVITEAEIIQAVEHIGYGAAPANGNSAAKPASDARGGAVKTAEKESKSMRNRLIWSFVFLIPLMYVSMHHMLWEWFHIPVPPFITAWFHGSENALTFAFTQLLLVAPILYLNRKYFENGFRSLVRLSPNMDTLIAVGASASVIYGVYAIYAIGIGMGHGDWEAVSAHSMDLYFESAGTILTLITLGKYLETRSKGKTTEAITKLMDLAPKTAMVLQGEQEVEVPIESVKVGDIVVVRTGQSIPVDGVVVQGSASVDQSAITGESIPVEKQAGDPVTGATMNQSGYLQIRAEKVGGDTTLSQIIQLVEDASASKAPIARLADKISGIFVPVVMSIAVIATIVWLILGYSFSFALSIGIAVLVISCPCALGLATPVAIMVGTGKGASNGILIKSSESLETAHSIQTVVLDKTGTITEGKMRVTDVIHTDRMTKEQFLEIAASLEVGSEHPLADAVTAYAKEQQIAPEAMAFFRSIPGRGVTGKQDGHTFLAGNLQMMQEHQIDTAHALEFANRLADQGKTALYFAEENHFIGMIGVADTIKLSSKAAIQSLKKMGISVVMLTGDNKRTAQAICQQLQVDRVVAEVLPQEKEQEIRKLQESGQRVAMVGDGINDAPALMRADVGIAIGAGTDIAIESADIVLMKSTLQDVVTAIQLSKAVMRNIKENLFWAFFYNACGIPLAAGVFFGLFEWKLNPMFAAAAMSCSSVCVVLNALRLKLFRPKLLVEQNTAAASMEQTATETMFYEERNQSNIKENLTMTKTMTIEGMSCNHCKMAVERALKKVEGVTDAVVDLTAKQAEIQLSQPVADEVLMNAVNEEGFTAVRVDGKDA